MGNNVTFTYKNHRGEISVRLVRPMENNTLVFGSNEFHPEPQWLLRAWDLQKDALRAFAMKDIKDWEPAP